MATMIKLKRGNTAQCKAYLAQPGELFVDTETLQLRVGDGATHGGNIVINITFGPRGPYDPLYAETTKGNAILIAIPQPDDARNCLP